MCSHFQVIPEMFGPVQVRSLAGPLRYIHRVMPKPCPGCLVSVLGLIILLEGKPSAKSEILRALDQVFFKVVFDFAPFGFPSVLTSLPVPAAEKQPQSMMLPPPCFNIGMVFGR